MESFETKITFVLEDTVLSCYEVPKEGWFFKFGGDRYGLWRCKGRPPFEAGDKVRLTFEKINDSETTRTLSFPQTSRGNLET